MSGAMHATIGTIPAAGPARGAAAAWRHLFSEHPASVGMTYAGHMAFAFRMGGTMALAGLACCVHGVLPFLFTTTGSRTILALHARISAAHRRPADPDADFAI